MPLGNSALIVEFGRKISVDLNERSIALAQHLDAHPFPGYIESVPAYASTAVFYDPLEVLRSNISSDGTAFETVAAHVESILSKTSGALKIEDRRIAIPVSFSKEDALDLTAISDRSGLGPNDVIEIFTTIRYRVFMLGFLPGFAYMGEVDAKIA
ncbi:MAG: 5-oxoprolinase subunit B family protein, partial [Pyrinomonadaceae bacterium]